MTQTMLELADDIADIPHEVNLTPRQARLLQEAANRLRETAALPPSQEAPAQPQTVRKATIKRYIDSALGWQLGDGNGLSRADTCELLTKRLAAALSGKPSRDCTFPNCNAPDCDCKPPASHRGTQGEI